MANKNFFFSSMPSVLLFLVMVANLVMLLAPPVNSALLAKKHEKCLVYNPAKSEAGGHRVKRVAGGSVGDIHKMPWMVNIKSNYTYKLPSGGTGNSKTECTGALVSRRYVITAAHCAPLDRMPNSSYMITVQYGSADKTAPKGVITLPTANFHVNPQSTMYFVNNTAAQQGVMSVNPHDTALIDLGRDLHLDETVQPVCVACLDNVTNPQGPAIIAGWGNIDPPCSGGAGHWPNVFNYERVSVHPCLTLAWAGADKVCTFANSTQGLGGGDSGGPLLGSANNGKTFLLMGVMGTRNCLSNAREDGSSKIDKEWFERITGVKCKKFNTNENCEDDV